MYTQINEKKNCCTAHFIYTYHLPIKNLTWATTKIFLYIYVNERLIFFWGVGVIRGEKEQSRDNKSETLKEKKNLLVRRYGHNVV